MSIRIDHIPGTKDFREKLLKNPRKNYQVRPLNRIRKIAVHHSLTRTGSAESFARYHINHHDWPGIGYHFVIEKDGTAKWCNDLTVKSYHVGNSNEIAVGICLVGDFREEMLEDRQRKPLMKLLRFLLRELDLTRHDILGHNEFEGYGWKACPCVDMHTIRDQAGQKQLLTGSPKLPFGGADTLLHPELTFNPNELVTKPGESVIAAANRMGLFDMGEIKVRNRTENLRKPSKKPVPVKVKGPVESIPGPVHQIISALERKGYQVFKSDRRPFNLNIVGVRSESAEPNSFDDELMIFWKYQNQWTFKKFKATTDPGLTYLLDPLNEAGTAILKEGQYRGAYRLGLHRNKYTALVQAEPVTVIRDFNRDDKLDFRTGVEQTGFFGINIHRASPSGESTLVNRWSAGCQVLANINEYNELIRFCKDATAEWGEKLTYTLIRKNDLV
jgi:hypothetical protein